MLILTHYQPHYGPHGEPFRVRCRYTNRSTTAFFWAPVPPSRPATRRSTKRG